MKFVVFSASLFLVSCVATKKLLPVPQRTKEEVLQSLKDRNIDFEWFEAKMNTSLDSPDEQVSGTMILRMKKDSAILVAVKKFGIEAARVFIDKNDYTILYRLEAAYESGPISDVKQLTSISANYEDLQQLIFGNVILPDAENTMMTKDSIYYVISGTENDLFLEYYVNGYNLQLEKMKITDKMNRTAVADYGDYKSVKGFGHLPYSRIFQFPYNESGDATIEMEFSSIAINVPTDLKFSIPSRYEKIN